MLVGTRRLRDPESPGRDPGGQDHRTCALLDTGAVRCWGRAGLADNEPSGQLGYGNNVKIGDNEVPACAGDVPLDER